MTTQYHSTLYSLLWLQSVNYKSEKLIESAHKRTLCIALGDHRRMLDLEELSGKACRVPPSQRAKYSTATLVMKTLRYKMPAYLYKSLKDTLFTEQRKPLNRRFQNNGKGKIRKLRLQNRINCINGIKDEWMILNTTDNDIRKILKNNYFDHEKIVISVLN